MSQYLSRYNTGYGIIPETWPGTFYQIPLYIVDIEIHILNIGYSINFIPEDQGEVFRCNRKSGLLQRVFNTLFDLGFLAFKSNYMIIT